MMNSIRIALAVSIILISACIATVTAAKGPGKAVTDRKSPSSPALSTLSLPPSGPGVDDDDDDEEDEDWNPKSSPLVNAIFFDSHSAILTQYDDEDEDDDDDYSHLINHGGFPGAIPVRIASFHQKTDARGFEDDETEDDDDPGDDDDGRAQSYEGLAYIL